MRQRAWLTPSDGVRSNAVKGPNRTRQIRPITSPLRQELLKKKRIARPRRGYRTTDANVVSWLVGNLLPEQGTCGRSGDDACRAGRNWAAGRTEPNVIALVSVTVPVRRSFSCQGRKGSGNVYSEREAERGCQLHRSGDDVGRRRHGRWGGPRPGPEKEQT